MKQARRAQNGEVVIVELTPKGSWVSEPVSLPSIGYRIGRDEVSASKIDVVECEAIIGNDDDADNVLRRYPQILRTY